ncbi:hypothetical protein AX15_004320 [Amanita polypyramis BW_CC]|nr:hypothetical protein AX15_004320 [Amanita polypyramis BW_CC]
MSMRAASSLYVHPELTDSEVWYKPLSESTQSHRRLTGSTVMYAALLTLSVAAASAITVVSFTNIGKLIQESPLVQRWL